MVRRGDCGEFDSNVDGSCLQGSVNDTLTDGYIC